MNQQIQQENREIRFINDEKREIKRDDMRNKISLKDLNIDKNILKAIELKRGLIMNEMREADRFKLNVIQFNDIVNSFLCRADLFDINYFSYALSKSLTTHT